MAASSRIRKQTFLGLMYNQNMLKNFQIKGDFNNPYHLSIGSVVLNKTNVTLLKKSDGSYTLPRETMYSQESLEESLIRGVQEEIGIVVKIEKFLGSLITHFKRLDGSDIEKTTIYFLVNKIDESSKNRENGEAEDEIVQMKIAEAMSLLRKQNNEEYKILSRTLGHKSSN